MSRLKIGDREFDSRLFLGTGKFSSESVMREAIIVSGSQLVTVALKRVSLASKNDTMLDALNISEVHLLPNTSGARDAREAVFAARLAREALECSWVKLEIHPDPRYLLPDPVETLEAAKILVQEGFTVLPYVNADPVLCKKLEDIGVAAVMPLGSPIGSKAGLQTRAMLEIIITETRVPVVIDAGLGAPSHAAEAIEMGAAAVLVNTAIAVARDPVLAAKAFRLAVEAGSLARYAALAQATKSGSPTSPMVAFLD